MRTSGDAMPYLRLKLDRRHHERRRTPRGRGRCVADVVNGDMAPNSGGELHLDDLGASSYCPWCGRPMRYVGSANRSTDDPNTVHVYECITDSRIYLIPESGFSRRRPLGWTQP